MATTVWLHVSTNMRLTEGLVSVLKEERPEYLPALLANYREHGVVSSQNSAAVGGLIGLSNGRLGSSKTRFEGLCLLAVLVKDSSSDVFQQHCLSWLRSLQQVIQSQAPLPSVQLAVAILQDLLQYSSQLPELAREVGLNSILGILTSLLGLKLECHLVAMEGMKACMTFYPRACGSLRDKLGAYFLSKMDSDNPRMQEVACECYGRLPCLGGVLERGGGSRRAEAWANQMHCLLATAHGLLGQLYLGAESEGTLQYEGPGVELPFPPLDETDPLLQIQLRHRYRAVSLAIMHTLSADPVSPVCVPVQSLINLVCRALAVSCKNISASGDGSLKLLVLPSIHSDTLELLSALITVAGGRLVQYCGVLTRLLSQTLSAWSPQPESSPGQQRAFSAVRVCLYRMLELWVQVAGASAGVFQGSPTQTELLLMHLLGDITPGAESVKTFKGEKEEHGVIGTKNGMAKEDVSVTDGSTHSDMPPSLARDIHYNLMAKLAGHAGKTPPRRGKGMGDGSGVMLQRKGDALANQDTCVSALRALRQIILTNGTLLKEDIHKRLQDLVLPLCVRLQQQLCGSDVGGAIGQYGSAQPRRELYRLLLALVLAPSPRWPPPLSCAVSIFSHGRRDPSLSVSSFCAEALTICNSLLHPRVPSISLPLPPLAVKPTPAAPTLTSSQNLSLPTLLGGPAPAPPFPPRHPLGLGPTGLLTPLENHLPPPPPVLPAQTGPTSAQGELLLSPPQPGELPPLGPPEGRRPVFIRYDKEEPEDVEISLESDSDDSVVIVPPGMLMLEGQDPASTQPLQPPPGAPVSGLALGTGSETGAVNSPLPNELPTTMALPSNSSAVATFPGQSQTPLVSLVPPLNSAAQLTTPSVGLGDSLPGTQLQQMLLQSSPAGQASQLGLMQLQTQMAQSSRQLQQTQQQAQQPIASEEDLTVININSSDEDEDEEEEMDEDDIGEEEEEEEDEPLDDDDEEEEEEVSDFPEDYYDGEEFADYEEEEEEMIEEEEGIIEGEEEDVDELPQLEGESRSVLLEEEEGEALMGPVGESAMGMFSGEDGDERDEPSDELEGQTAMYRKEGVQDEVKQTEEGDVGIIEEKLHKGKLEEEAKEGAASLEFQIGRQPLMTVRETSQEAELAQDAEAESRQEVSLQEQGSTEEAEAPAVSETAVLLEESTESAQDAGETEDAVREEAVVELPLVEHGESKEQQTCPEEEAVAARQSKMSGLVESEEVGQEESDNNSDDSRGMKRKREKGEIGEGEQSVEKKKLDEEAMASMLADFVDCPPDEEENVPSPVQS